MFANAILLISIKMYVSAEFNFCSFFDKYSGILLLANAPNFDYNKKIPYKQWSCMHAWLVRNNYNFFLWEEKE